MKSFTTIAILIAATPALLASPSMKAPSSIYCSMPLNVVVADSSEAVKGVIELIIGIGGIILGGMTLKKATSN